MKRILTFDLLRGLAIILMLVFHLFFIMYDFSWANKYVDDPSIAPLWILILGGLVLYLQSWGGFFLLISMSVNTYVMNKKLRENMNPHTLLLKQEISGGFLFVVAVFTETIMHFRGFLGTLVINHVFQPKLILQRLLIVETLHTISLSLIITSFFVYMLSVTGFLKKERLTLLIYASTIASILLLTPVLQAFTFKIYPDWPAPQQNFQFNGIAETLKLFVFSLVIGYPEPLFPYLATGFMGSAIGYAASQNRPSIKLIPILISIGMVIFGWGLYRDFHGYSMSPFLRSNFTWYLLGFGGQLIALAVFMYFIEFKGYTTFLKKWTTPIRRFSMVSLTVYSFQLWSYSLYYPLQWSLGWKIIEYKGLSLWQAIIVLILTLLYWHVCLKLWEKKGFVGSLEWMMRVLISRKVNYESSKANVQGILYDMEPIVFVEKK